MQIRKKSTIKLKGFYMVAIAIILLLVGHDISAKTKPTKGVDTNGNAWTYDKETKTLTFKGSKDLEVNLMDGHSKGPEWLCWREEAKHLVIKEGITGIADGDFFLFSELRTVILPDTVTYIGDCVFQDCLELREIQFSKNIIKIGDYAFLGCEQLGKIQIPKNVSSIGCEAFYACNSLTEIVIPDSVKEIGEDAFGECSKLKKVKLPKNLKVISGHLFFACESLVTVTIPDSVTTIYASAFKESGIKKIVIPKNVKYIKKGDWSGGLFTGCKDLKSIVIKSKKIESCYKDAFKGVNDNVVIQVPQCKLKEYKALFQKNGLSKKVKIKSIS
ncbi:leucine-rich repeat domain-containing protein [Anaerosporobacter sp.]|uniref:leucine-rich repeat domain-containing protein n=1 Tax=Anaerosporobacter sp. TaxID=1872529 RepID=UPI00286EC810|nr:leucine-rich repeat domain-containing protein [Anaerosporobacter sp.]